MVRKPRPLIAGNWKMNGDLRSLSELKTIAAELSGQPSLAQCMIFPPFTLLSHAHTLAKGSPLEIGAQDCSQHMACASTGDISAIMIAEFASAVLVGHSERRTLYSETDEIVAAKYEMALDAGLTAIVCIGETRDERTRGTTLDVVTHQLSKFLSDRSQTDNTVVAYEPVWAIGSGLTPSVEEIEAVHGCIRGELSARLGPTGESIRILYGGSMNPSNASVILGLENVDGGLIGGASLTADSFLSIYRQATEIL
jgi:triosephosphate isomerase (TIM)